MKKFSKLASVALCLALSVVALAGCGGSKNPSGFTINCFSNEEATIQYRDMDGIEVTTKKNEITFEFSADEDIQQFSINVKEYLENADFNFTAVEAAITANTLVHNQSIKDVGGITVKRKEGAALSSLAGEIDAGLYLVGEGKGFAFDLEKQTVEVGDDAYVIYTPGTENYYTVAGTKYVQYKFSQGTGATAKEATLTVKFVIAAATTA